jgi:hypothetical protein
MCQGGAIGSTGHAGASERSANKLADSLLSIRALGSVESRRANAKSNPPPTGAYGVPSNAQATTVGGSVLRPGPTARTLHFEFDMLLTILVIILLLMALGSVPGWPHSRSWGYYPSGGLGLVVIILLVFFLMSPRHVWW